MRFVQLSDDWSVDEQDVFDRAVSAYVRRCDREGWLYQQPGRYDGGIDEERGVIDLCNINGRLATYRIIETETGFRLEYVEDSYAEIDDPE